MRMFRSVLSVTSALVCVWSEGCVWSNVCVEECVCGARDVWRDVCGARDVWSEGCVEQGIV